MEKSDFGGEMVFEVNLAPHPRKQGSSSDTHTDNASQLSAGAADSQSSEEGTGSTPPDTVIFEVMRPRASREGVSRLEGERSPSVGDSSPVPSTDFDVSEPVFEVAVAGTEEEGTAENAAAAPTSPSEKMADKAIEVPAIDREDVSVAESALQAPVPVDEGTADEEFELDTPVAEEVGFVEDDESEVMAIEDEAVDAALELEEPLSQQEMPVAEEDRSHVPEISEEETEPEEPCDLPAIAPEVGIGEHEEAAVAEEAEPVGPQAQTPGPTSDGDTTAAVAGEREHKAAEPAPTQKSGDAQRKALKSRTRIFETIRHWGTRRKGTSGRTSAASRSTQPGKVPRDRAEPSRVARKADAVSAADLAVIANAVCESDPEHAWIGDLYLTPDGLFFAAYAAVPTRGDRPLHRSLVSRGVDGRVSGIDKVVKALESAQNERIRSYAMRPSERCARYKESFCIERSSVDNWRIDASELSISSQNTTRTLGIADTERHMSVVRRYMQGEPVWQNPLLQVDVQYTLMSPCELLEKLKRAPSAIPRRQLLELATNQQYLRGFRECFLEIGIEEMNAVLAGIMKTPHSFKYALQAVFDASAKG